MPADDPRSDQELVTAINGGDYRAFEALYYRYRDWTARIARRFTGHEEDALDVLQETFSYLLSKFPGFVLKARLTSFLYPAIRNLALAQRRKRVRAGAEASLEDLPAPPSPTAPDEELAQRLAALPAAQREVVLMRFVDDLTVLEIATALKIPEGTVKSRLHHAIAQLRSTLTPP